MQFKEDWDRAKERFEAFWQGEVLDRCCIAVTAPRNNPVNTGIVSRPPISLEEQWLSPEYRLGKFLNECANTFYGGEAFPSFCVDLGPGVVAAFMGCSHILAPNTVWFDTDPIIKEWSSKPEIRLYENSEMWKVHWGMSEFFYKNAQCEFKVGVTDLGGNFDIAVSTRGTQELLFDLYDEPDEVSRLIEAIDKVWIEVCDKLYSLNDRFQDGYTSWMPLWSSERWYPLQCDFSVMLSPVMFEKFVKPSLAREAKYLGKAIYHLDGPGQIQHLDHILEIEGIEGIEWVPMPQGIYLGTGNEEWFPLYKKIQQKGKKLVLRSMDPSAVERVLDNISPKGLFITTSCDSEEDAAELLCKAGKWTAKAI